MSSLTFTAMGDPSAADRDAAVAALAKTTPSDVARAAVAAVLASGLHTIDEVSHTAQVSEEVAQAAVESCRHMLFIRDLAKPDLPSDRAVLQTLALHQDNEASVQDTVEALRAEMHALNNVSPECTAHLWSINQRRAALQIKMAQLGAS